MTRKPPPADDVLALGVALSGLALLAPLEFGAGLWFGLAPPHALTITLVVEGFAALTIWTGRLVPLALTLTTISALVGMLHAAAEHAGALDPRGTSWARFADPDVVTALAGGAVVTGIAVTALAGTHRIRRAVVDERAAAAAAVREREDLERVRELEHERELSARAVEAEERAAREQRAEMAARRAHEETQQRARLFADQERARLDVERARLAVDAEQARAATERARADAERAENARLDRERTEKARAERAARPADTAPAAPPAERAPRAPRTAAVDEVTERAVRRDWERAEGTPEQWTGDALAARLGVHPATGRKTAQRWRDERAKALIPPAGNRTETAR